MILFNRFFEVEGAARKIVSMLYVVAVFLKWDASSMGRSGIISPLTLWVLAVDMNLSRPIWNIGL